MVQASLIGSDGGGDVLEGLGDNDYLNGLRGDDTLIGGVGADTLVGGLGLDTASYEGSNAGVTINLATGVSQGGHAQGDTFSGIERVFGSSHGDILTGSAGNDVLEGAGGDDELRGGGGDDLLIGGAGADFFSGGAGFDTISYASSTARVRVSIPYPASSEPNFGQGLEGDARGDRIADFERLIGTRFDDELSTGRNATLEGGDGNDSLTSFLAEGVLRGGAGSDVLVGGQSVDVLDGGEGFDSTSYVESNAGVTIDLVAGTGLGGYADGDTLVSIEQVTGSRYRDVLRGSNAAEVLLGGAGNDDLFGEGGNDQLDGGNGNDLLFGGAGSDQLVGGGGVDTFVFAGASGSDTIVDFGWNPNGGDVINLTGSVFADFADVLAHTNDNGSGGTVISKSGVTITLIGVLKSQLYADDFVFGTSVPGMLDDKPHVLPVEEPVDKPALTSTRPPHDDPLVLLEARIFGGWSDIALDPRHGVSQPVDWII